MQDKGQVWRSFGDALGGVRQAVSALNSYLSSQHQAEQRLEVLFNLSPDLLCIADETHLRWLNPAWERQLGWTIAELLSNPIETFIHPDDLEANRAAVSLLAQEPVGHHEVRWRHKDGSYRWLAWSASQRVDGQTYAVVQDISERKRADDAMRCKHQQQARLLAIARYLVSSLDIEQVLTRIAEETREMTGADGCRIYLLESNGRTLTPVVAIDPPHEAVILTTPLGLQDTLAEQTLRAKKGLVFYDASVEGWEVPGLRALAASDERVIVVPLIAHEQPLGCMFLHRHGAPFSEEDLALAEELSVYAAIALKKACLRQNLAAEMAERSRAEQACHESQVLLRSAVESLPCDLVALGADGRCVLQNSSSTKRWGNIVGKFPEQTPISQQVLILWLESSLRALQGETVTGQVDLAANGETGTYHQIVAPIRDGDEIRGVLGIHVDITEQKRTERALREALAELGQRDEVQTAVLQTAGEQLEQTLSERADVQCVACATANSYQGVLESIVDGVWVADRHDVVSYVNRGMEVIAGIAREKLVGKHILNDFPDTTTAHFRSYYLKARETLQPVHYPAVSVRTPVGRASLQSGWLIPRVVDGQYDGMICTIEDVTERARYQELQRALHASEARFRGLLNASSDMTMLVDRDLRILAINDALAARVGHTPDQLLGRRLDDPCMGGIMTPSRQVHLEQVFRSGNPTHFEDERLGRLLDVVFYPVYDIDGQAMAVAIYGKDTTAAREAQQTLRQQTEWQAQLLESARHLTASLEIEQVLTRIATEAKTVLRAYGSVIYLLEPDGQTLTPVVALEPPFEAEILSAPLQVDRSFTGGAVKAKRGLVFNNAFDDEAGMQIPGTPVQQDERVMVVPFIVEEEVLGAMCLSRRGTPFTPDDLALGETFAAYAATALKNARVHRVLQREVEERKRAEQALRESEQRFRTIVETAPSVLHIINPQGRTIYASPNCAQITGYTQEELRARTKLWVHEGDAPRAQALFERIRREKRGFRGFEYRAVRKNGELWHASSSGEPLFDEAGQVTSIIVQTSDITERVRLGERLREAQKMEAVGRLAGGVAHEFNNLLMVIVGYGEFALTALQPDDPLREDMEAICRAGRRAAELTQQLLAFSRRQTFRAQVMHLNTLLQDMIGALRFILGNQVEVIAQLCDGRGSVRADVAQIEQVITHLATNARDAMPDGGAFTLETSNILVDAEQADVSPGEYVLLTASDTGCGMSPEVQQHLFEPFFTTKEVGRGTGLGLATIYGIITQLGGSIQVESEVGRGTTVRIYLPRVIVSEEDPGL